MYNAVKNDEPGTTGFAFPKSETDFLLNGLGFDLVEECQVAVQMAKLSPDRFVLDVGTGQGRMAAALLGAGHLVISGDIDPERTREAQAKFAGAPGGRISFTNFDAEKTGFPGNFFDGVVCANLLHELRDPFAVLWEMARVCKGFGKLIVVDFNEKGFGVIGDAYRKSHGKEHDRYFVDTGSVEDFLRKNFEDVRMLNLPLNHVWLASGKISQDNQNIPAHSSCFACGHRSLTGHNLTFKKTGEDSISASHVVNSEYGGYPGIVQGGAAATILDSAMANCLYICRSVQGVTARLEVSYSRPIELNVPVEIEAGITGTQLNMFELWSRIRQNGATMASAKGLFFPYQSGG